MKYPCKMQIKSLNVYMRYKPLGSQI